MWVERLVRLKQRLLVQSKGYGLLRQASLFVQFVQDEEEHLGGVLGALVVAREARLLAVPPSWWLEPQRLAVFEPEEQEERLEQLLAASWLPHHRCA